MRPIGALLADLRGRSPIRVAEAWRVDLIGAADVGQVVSAPCRSCDGSDAGCPQCSRGVTQEEILPCPECGGRAGIGLRPCGHCVDGKVLAGDIEGAFTAQR